MNDFDLSPELGVGTLQDRRSFLKASLATAMAAGSPLLAQDPPPARPFKISCAAWSLHREVQAGTKLIDLFRVVREELDISAFELVNGLMEVPTLSYVDRLRQEAEKYEVEIPLIMVDNEGELGHEDGDARRRAVKYHMKWIEIAADLGCSAVRVNWRGERPDAERDDNSSRIFIRRSAGSFQTLADRAAQLDLDIVIENHGGLSGYPAHLMALVKFVNQPRLGTLPDFGNFPDEVDRYDAVDQMMPFARAVSAKCKDFDEAGNETTIDFERMLQIVVDKHKYFGFLGVEYEGDRLSERDGIRACRDLLRRLRGDAV